MAAWLTSLIFGEPDFRLPLLPRAAAGPRRPGSFRAVREDLLALADWRRVGQVARVGMEATSDYWKPVYFRPHCASPTSGRSPSSMPSPGFGITTAQDVIAEIGSDMSVFPTAGHLRSWAKYAPGVSESAGKRKGKNATGRGNPYIGAAIGKTAIGYRTRSRLPRLGTDYATSTTMAREKCRGCGQAARLS